eukprot:1895691-Ditylum_brightwellii.AAC.1
MLDVFRVATTAAMAIEFKERTIFEKNFIFVQPCLYVLNQEVYEEATQDQAGTNSILCPYVGIFASRREHNTQC